MSEKIRTIVVGVAAMRAGDPKIAPPGEDPVLGAAASLAQQLGASLHVVHVLERPDPVRTAYTHAVHTEAAVAQHCDAVAEQLREQTRRFANASRIHCRCLEGGADVQLCGYAEKIGADLIVVGATRRGWVWQNILGSTADGVLRRATVPVLVSRRAFRNPARHVLLTTDLSELSPAVHEVGLDLVERLFGTEPLELRSLLVCWYDTVAAARVSEDLIATAATTRLREFLQDRRPRRRPVQDKVRIGNPSTEIVREAGEWKADLVVLGTHGRWGLSRWVLGSTAGATLRGLSCNALVIPAACAPDRGGPNARRGSEQAETGFPGTEEHPEPGTVLLEP